MDCMFFFFKQKTAYEMRISDWSSDVCSSDLCLFATLMALWRAARSGAQSLCQPPAARFLGLLGLVSFLQQTHIQAASRVTPAGLRRRRAAGRGCLQEYHCSPACRCRVRERGYCWISIRSEEPTSELQS